jgi:hypothetical protein
VLSIGGIEGYLCIVCEQDTEQTAYRPGPDDQYLHIPSPFRPGSRNADGSAARSTWKQSLATVIYHQRKRSMPNTFPAGKNARVCAALGNQVESDRCPRAFSLFNFIRSKSMQLFIWRHSKRFSSWSMLDEPHIHRENYLQAEVTVLAASKDEALRLLEGSGNWDIDELRRIEPETIPLDAARIITSHVDFQ